MSQVPPLSELGSPKILVLGDLILDEYLWGDVARISPEAPVPVLRVRHREHRCGGAGSVIENLVVLGAQVAACGLIGNDQAGDTMTERFEELGVTPLELIRCEDRPTTLKTRMLGGVQHASRGQQQVLRVDWEDNRPVEVELLKSVTDAIGRMIQQFSPDVVLVSDYEKGLLTEEILQFTISVAGKAGIPVLIDPGRTVDYSRYRGAFLICPNRFETEQATGHTLTDRESAHEAGRVLLDQLQLQHAALTLDRDGIELVSQGEDPRSFPTRVRAVTDVAGAGDMVLSCLGLGVGAGWPIEDCIRLANLAAGVEVSKIGVTPVEPWEIEQAAVLDGGEVPSKVRGLAELVRILERERAAGTASDCVSARRMRIHSPNIATADRSAREAPSAPGVASPKRKKSRARHSSHRNPNFMILRPIKTVSEI